MFIFEMPLNMKPTMSKINNDVFDWLEETSQNTNLVVVTSDLPTSSENREIL